MEAPPRFIVSEAFKHQSPDYVRQAAQRNSFKVRTTAGSSKSEIWVRQDGAGAWIIRLDSQGHGQWHHGSRPHYHKNWVPLALLEQYLRRFTPDAVVYDDGGALIGPAGTNVHPEHKSKAQHIPR